MYLERGWERKGEGVRKRRKEGKGRKMARERNIYVLRHLFLDGYFLLDITVHVCYNTILYVSAIVLDKLMYSHSLPHLYWYWDFLTHYDWKVGLDVRGFKGREKLDNIRKPWLATIVPYRLNCCKDFCFLCELKGKELQGKTFTC